MIQSLAPRTFAPPAARPALPAAVPGAPPADPAEGPISDPYEAARLPFLDPGFQIALSVAGAAGALPSTTGFVIAVTGTVGERAVDLEYRNAPDGVRSSGRIGEDDVSERLHALEQGTGLRFEGAIGPSREDLTMVPRSGELAVTGTLGQEGADLSFRFHNEGEELVLTIDGQISGQPYRTVSRMTMDPSSYEGSMKTEGNIGEEPIAKEFAMRPTEDGAFLIEGRGTVAGAAQDLTYRVVAG